MKSLSLTIVAILCSILAFSQVEYSIFGGPQATTASYTVQSVKQKTSYKIGFQLGAGLKVPFDTRLYFTPALVYSLKGYKVNFNRFSYPPDPAAIDNNTTFHTVETVFMLHYDFNDKPSHWYLAAGPSLDFQLFGKEKFHTATASVDRKMEFAYDKYGHFSANFIGHLGYQMSNGFFVYGQYSYGLANLNNFDTGPRIRHRVFGISIGKTLGTKG